MAVRSAGRRDGTDAFWVKAKPRAPFSVIAVCTRAQHVHTAGMHCARCRGDIFPAAGDTTPLVGVAGCRLGWLPADLEKHAGETRNSRESAESLEILQESQSQTGVSFYGNYW